MNEIVIRKDGDKWVAFVGEKRIAVGNCRNCVVSVVLAVTKQSSRYDKVVIHEENGTFSGYLTGDGNGRTAAKDL